MAPLLGGQATLTEAEWATITAKLAPHERWLGEKAGALVEKLGLPRVREILAEGRTQIEGLLAKDKALDAEFSAIAAVDKLVRYHRDLYALLNNFVSFRTFYGRRDKAMFQVGTLYLDQRSCDLCVRVQDMAKHSLLAHLSRACLVAGGTGLAAVPSLAAMLRERGKRVELYYGVSERRRVPLCKPWACSPKRWTSGPA